MKSGFVNIIGNPNVGKSTLMNAMLGERLSIITSKAQTTRHRIFGIANGDDYQIVFSDTPGIIQPAYTLQERMMDAVKAVFEDADLLVVVVEPNESEIKDEKFVDRINAHNAPLLLVINKIDTIQQEQLEKVTEIWTERLPRAEIIPISALKQFHTDYLLSRILNLLPEGMPFYDRDAITDRSERFFASEIIREKILINYEKEVPYSVEVEIESFKAENHLLSIRALIHVARDSQKGILIGHKGKAIQNLGTQARLDLEKFFQQKVFLDLYVKVNKNWRENDTQLRRFGYN